MGPDEAGFPLHAIIARTGRGSRTSPSQTSAITNKRPPRVGSRPSVRLPLNAGSSKIAASEGSVLTSAFGF